jgi:hypothetical protein
MLTSTQKKQKNNWVESMIIYKMMIGHQSYVHAMTSQGQDMIN